MQLLRFAIVSFSGELEDWASFTVEHDGVTVSSIDTWQRQATTDVLLLASKPMDARPVHDDDSLVVVPDDLRRAAEEAIEVAANVVSVAAGHARALSSPALPVAFKAEDDDERRWLSSQRGLASAGKGTAMGRLTVSFSEEQVASLSDRDAGVALMSEALAQRDLTGRFRVLLLLFEQAFKSPPGRLITPLAEFLARRQGLGYTRTEVKAWIERLRGRAMHADRRPPLIEADLRPVGDRVLLAAYEVLVNKRTWGTADSLRRDTWTPIAGPLDREGRWFVLQHSAPSISAQLYDAFGAYVQALEAPRFKLPDDFWPRETPPELTAPQASVEVVAAERLAVTEMD